MEEYKYKNCELVPIIFKEILIEKFINTQFSRQDAISIIKDFHIQNGGILNKNDLIGTFKHTKKLMDKEGLYNLENISYGIWKLTKNENSKDCNINYIKSSLDKKELFTVQKIIGQGDEEIYIYYYDIYKRFANLNGDIFFECKIGKTKKDSITRIFSQEKTSHPELPIIALVIKTDNANLLEKSLHNILELKGRKLEDSPGKEWFLTNPEEIEDIYKYIIGE